MDLKFLKDKWNLSLIGIIFAFAVSQLILINRIFFSDEGTHALLTFFYRDLIIHFLKHPGIHGTVTFALRYLIHYPKLTLYHPPLYHLIGVIAISIVRDIHILRVLSMLYGIGSIVMVYLISKDFTNNNKKAIIASVLFATAPIIYISSHWIMLESLLVLMSLVLIYIWYNYLEKNKFNWWQVTLISSVAVFTKLPILLVFFSIFVYAIIYKKFKKALLPLAIAGVVFISYMLILNHFGIAKMIISEEAVASQEHDPTFKTLAGWIYYPKTIFISYLFAPIAFLSFVGFYKWLRKPTKWKVLLLVLFTINFGFIFVTNKNMRFIILTILPLVLAASDAIVEYTKKINFGLVISAVSLSVVAYLAFWMININPQYLQSEIYINPEIFQDDGNILVATEQNFVYSSTIMAYYNEKEGFDSRIFFRPCVLFSNNYSVVNNSRYILLITPFDNIYGKQYSKIAEKIPSLNLTLIKEINSNGVNIKIYYNPNYEPLGGKNYICAKEKWITPSLASFS